MYDDIMAGVELVSFVVTLFVVKDTSHRNRKRVKGGEGVY